ncbi:MAG: SCO family protein [Hyphomicrobiales bacterium]|nr:SCO family protein [Hyphomicrobiales bacterium]
MAAEGARSAGSRIAVGLVAALGLTLAVLGIESWVRTGRNEAIDMFRVGGPFTLTTQNGDELSDGDLKGTPFAVFFGFTRCPEICPTTLWEMSEALKTLGPDAERLKVLFISVDPTRDTPEFLARYLQSFDRRIVGLTGSEADIAAVGKEYRAFWEKVPTGDGDYTMNHTASIFLMDGSGTFVGTITYGESMEVRLEKLRRLIRGDSA